MTDFVSATYHSQTPIYKRSFWAHGLPAPTFRPTRNFVLRRRPGQTLRYSPRRKPELVIADDLHLAAPGCEKPDVAKVMRHDELRDRVRSGLRPR